MSALQQWRGFLDILVHYTVAMLRDREQEAGKTAREYNAYSVSNLTSHTDLHTRAKGLPSICDKLCDMEQYNIRQLDDTAGIYCHLL